ncbi:MAG TPA: tRNA uridine-5-carboxymethylaminomethyl(34) synthesis GTPase MnmE [Opitutaceae bacterium]|nr:tRNA uridine-5-carboxymethylaminomethyl(34) synthesis GTPase MnmE [Opitutaceae bacterium]
MLHVTDTIAALATPAGTSAIAVVRASGPDTGRLAVEIFGLPPSPRKACHADYRDIDGRLVDDVLFTFFQGPHSYTGEDSLEISSHGNPFIAQKILADLLTRGCRSAQPGEFTQRAFLNGQMDLSQAEAVMDLIHARSDRALAAANQQLRGALGKTMDALTHRLLEVLARVEAYIDFPEEDLPPEDTNWLDVELQSIAKDTQRLLATNRYGDMLREGIRTVILGAPNAGKSSLLNQLVGRDRALVGEEPGTTRDFIEEKILIGPHCLRLIDTAGLNPSPVPLEKRGIEKTLEQAEAADVFLLVLDATQPIGELPREFASRITLDRTILVLNKIDLVGTEPPPAPFPARYTVHTSALNGSGLDRLREAIGSLADSCQPEIGGERVSINARHAEALSRAQNYLTEARGKITGHDPVELLASDLRGALGALGEIRGKIDNERVLDRLFASFCIGK